MPKRKYVTISIPREMYEAIKNYVEQPTMAKLGYRTPTEFIMEILREGFEKEIEKIKWRNYFSEHPEELKTGIYVGEK